MTLKQPQLVKRGIKLLDVKCANPKATPAFNPLLNKNTDKKERNEDIFHKISAIRSLQSLIGCTRPGTSMAARQSTKFLNF